MENLTFPLCISETFLYIVCSPLYTDVCFEREKKNDVQFGVKLKIEFLNRSGGRQKGGMNFTQASVRNVFFYVKNTLY